MSKIIQINKLYDYNHAIPFGVVGIDLETKRIKYYSYYNEKEEYRPNGLYEFYPDQLKENSIIKEHMRDKNYKKYNLFDQAPTSMAYLTIDLLNKHQEYNLEHHYPVNYLSQNRKNLSLKYITSWSTFERVQPSALYIPVENEIQVITPRMMPDHEATEEEKIRIKNSLLHEIGHLKVTNYTINEEKNILHVKTGFYENNVKTRPIMLENNDIFYKIEQVPNAMDCYQERALEEIINDYDCSLVDPFYSGNYPKLGERLDRLCGNILLLSRYTKGADILYDHLYQIIPSNYLASELLEHIGNSIYGGDPKASENKAIQLIKKYENTLQKK